MRKTLTIGLLLLITCFLVSCEITEIQYEFGCNMKCVCDRLNKNVEFYKSTIEAYLRSGDVTYLYTEGESLVMSFDNLSPVRYYDLSYVDMEVPLVSVRTDSNGYYWTVNDQVVVDDLGRPLYVENESLIPEFSIIDSVWYISVNGNDWHMVEDVEDQAVVPSVVLSSNQDFLICTFDSSTQFIIPTIYLRSTIASNVPIQGFYKDVFMDAGVYLNTRNTLAAATYLGYTLESVSCTDLADTAWQNTVIGGNAEDINGRLLYPDGAPRYRILFVCGGKATKHGKTLRKECREKMQEFVGNGGSYVGTCAGAFFASRGYDSLPYNQYYLGLWPGVVGRTHLSSTNIGMSIENGSSLLNYYNYGGDNYVSNVYHNGGCFAADMPLNTEPLARYDCDSMLQIHGKVSSWAYKSNAYCGRVVVVGSHPEYAASGERRDFTAAMLRYAADGVGETSIKGLLYNGKTRYMDKTTSDGDPEYTMIGDMQYHHFVVYIPQGAHDIRLRVASAVDCNLQLSMKKGNYAYVDGTEYQSASGGSEQELVFDNLSEGLWYVAVQCLTTVTATDVTLGQEYSGRTDVLNGVPYTVSVAWD